MLLTRVACIFISGSVTFVLLLLFSLVQQLEWAEACRWYFFAVFYRIPMVIVFQSKTIAAKRCQTSPRTG